jgi:hypothetical protein
MKMRVSSSRAFVCVSIVTGMLLATFFLLYSRTTTFARNSSVSNKMAGEETTKKAPDIEKKASILAAYGKLPLAFERNKGQTDSQVQYLTHGSGYELFLTPKEAVLALWQPRKSQGRDHLSSTLVRPSEARATRKASVLRLQLASANPSPAITGIDQLERKANYFTGNDRASWVTDVPSYGRVEYTGIYPGINLDFYGNQRQLEYDFAVAPGADPKAIALKLQGGKSAHIDSRGNLVVGISSGSVSFRKPLIYQMEDGRRREIAGGYLLAKNDEVGFTVSDYDRARPLIIDPVLDYSTYLASSVTGDQAFGVAVDGNGNAFVTGQTFNATFPLSTSPATTVGLGTPDVNIGTNGGAFVSEINPAGTAELYFSYLSGDGAEVGYSVAVDPVANATCKNGLVNSFCVYVTGQTFSDNFPVGSVVTPYNAMAPTGGAPTGGNAFVTKLNPFVAGSSSLLYSSYLASTSAGDLGQGIAVDSTQDVYITGNVLSSPGAVPAFPILNGAQTTLPNASGNAYLTVMNTLTGALVYSTYLGGNDANEGAPDELGLGDIGWSVAVDSSKIAYIVGTTPSTNFPNLNSTGTFPSIKGWLGPNGSNSINEGFLAAINTTLTGVNSLVYSTYVGGSTADRANGVALAGSGVVYITGRTKSTDFVVTQTGTAGQFPSLPNVTGVVFITKLNTTATGAPSYSVLLGGTSGDIGNGIQLDTLGNVIVGGTTESPNFPVTPGAFKSSRGSVGDAFIAKINPAVTGSAGLLYSTYFGGSGVLPTSTDQGNGVALDTLNNAIIAGQTFSQTDFPISSGAFQTAFGSVSDTSAGFVSKLTLIPVLAFSSPCTFNLTVTPATSCALAFGNQTFHVASAASTFALTNNTGSNITLTIPPVSSGTNAADFVAAAAVSGISPACTTTLAAGASCGIGVTFTPSTAAAESAALTVSYTYNNGTSTPASQTQTVALTGTGTSPTVVLNPTTTLNFPTAQPIGTTSSALPVTVTNTGLGNLIFSAAPSIGGSEFAIGSTTCSTSTPLAQNGSCTINITFKPSATGARSATLTIADNAAGSPQTLSLTGTGVASAPIATVTPSTLAFSGQLVTTTSTAQTVTVKNTGNATLTISATPSISGTNASDFAIGTNTCTSGSTVAANATCTLNVTFTPPAGASGSRTATLSIADNASGSPQTVSLTGTAWDFSISAQPITVAPGSSGTIAVTVTGLGGFTGQVTLACSGTIPQGSCAGPASPVTAPGTGNVTVTTHSLVAPPSAMKLPPVSREQLSLGILALMLLISLPIVSRARTRLGLAGVAALLIFAAGCSNTPPTPANTYSVTITGTSGTVSHSITVNVTVS